MQRYAAMQRTTLAHDDASHGENGNISPSKLWFEAIATRRCVAAVYNGMGLILAPHNLYTRGEQLYVAAAVVERRGVPIADRKIGIFALAGLRDCVLLARSFRIEPGYDPADARFADNSVFAVEV